MTIIKKIFFDSFFVCSFIFAFLCFFIMIFYAKISLDYDFLYSCFNAVSFKTIFLLLLFMLIICALQNANFLEFLCYLCLKKINNKRALIWLLVMLTFFLSMFITNDVALLSFVPFALILLNKIKADKIIIFTLVMLSLAANLGSMLTPFGNPQNMFLFTHYSLSFNDFFQTAFKYCLLAFILLNICIFCFVKNEKIPHIKIDIKINKKIIFLNLFLFLLALLCIFSFLNLYFVLFVVILILFFTQKEVFLKLDYALLFSFINLFLAVFFLSKIINYEIKNIFISSIVLSFFISNVSASIFLSNFTNDFKDIFLGVNIAACTSLISSMANLIAFKFYLTQKNHNKKNYLLSYTYFSTAFFILLILFYYI